MKTSAVDPDASPTQPCRITTLMASLGIGSQ